MIPCQQAIMPIDAHKGRFSVEVERVGVPPVPDPGARLFQAGIPPGHGVFLFSWFGNRQLGGHLT